MKKTLAVLLTFLSLSSTAYGAFGDPFISLQLATDPDNGECLTTDGTDNIWGSCGSGSGGSNAVATSSAETSGYIPFWTSTNATPATLSGGDSGFQWDNTLKRFTATNAIFTTSTTTSATTTSLFSTTASSTNLFSTNFNLGVGTLGNATTTNIFSTTASSTNLFASNASTTNLTVSTLFRPNANDGVSLGVSGTAFSDLFLASGGVINFNAGDVTLTHSANVLSIDGGNVGIGESSPDRTLHVKQAAGDSVIEIENTGNGNDSILEFTRERLSGTDSTGGAIWLTSNTSVNDAELWLMAQTASAGPGQTGPAISLFDMSSGSNNYIKFYNDGNTLMTVRGDGNVGIGTTGPSSKLTIIGSSSTTTPQVSINPSGAIGDSAVLALNARARIGYDGLRQVAFIDDSGATKPIAFDTANVERIRITTTGLVGIGLTNPAYLLEVNGTASTTNLIVENGSLEIPNSTTPVVDAIGEIAIDTTDGQLLVATSTNAASPIVINPFTAFSVAYASTTQGQATSTIYIGTAPYALTVRSVQCDFSNFMGVSLFDGTNRTDYLVASSTVGTVTYSTNNTFTAGEAMRLDVGTSTNIAADVRGGCTFKVYPTRQ